MRGTDATVTAALLGAAVRANRTFMLAVVIGTVTACGESSGPDVVEGRYTLSTLNESPLPYDNEGLGCCWYLAGALTLSAPQYAISITARNFGGGEPFTVTEWGSYVFESATITFAPDSFDFAPLLLSPATVSGDAIDLGLGGEGPGSPDQFRARFVKD